jgi:hypothetical protein
LENQINILLKVTETQEIITAKTSYLLESPHKFLPTNEGINSYTKGIIKLNLLYFVRFEVLTAAVMKSTIF